MVCCSVSHGVYIPTNEERLSESHAIQARFNNYKPNNNTREIHDTIRNIEESDHVCVPTDKKTPPVK